MSVLRTPRLSVNLVRRRAVLKFLEFCDQLAQTWRLKSDRMPSLTVLQTGSLKLACRTAPPQPASHDHWLMDPLLPVLPLPPHGLCLHMAFSCVSPWVQTFSFLLERVQSIDVIKDDFILRSLTNYHPRRLYF